MLYFYSFTGLTQYTFRIPCLLLYVLSLFPIYFAVKHCKVDSFKALLITLTIMLMPVTHFFTGLMYLESFWWFFGSCFIYSAARLSNEEQEGSYSTTLLLMIIAAECCFFSRNLGLLFPVFIIFSVILHYVLNFRKSFAAYKKVLYAALTALLPIFYWHFLYTLYDRIEGTLRKFAFTFKAFTYWNGYKAYGEAVIKYIGILGSAVIVLAVINCLINLRKKWIYIFCLSGISGFIVMMLGDYGFKDWYGYGRFLLMPVIMVPVLLALMLKSVEKNKILSAVFSILLIVVVIEEISMLHIDPSKFVGRSGCELILPYSETDKMTEMIINTKDEKIACIGHTEILFNLHQLNMLPEPTLIYDLGDRHSFDSDKVLKFCSENNYTYLWECLEGGAILINKDPDNCFNRVPFKPVFDKNNLPAGMKLLGTVTGPNEVQYNKYEIQNSVKE
ncbi:MAG: hypothetical protein ACYTFY_15135 [Planctomycetota bacterium]